MGDPVTISFTIVNEPVPNVSREGIQWVFSGIGGAVNLSCTSTSKYSFSDNCLSLTVSNAEGSDAGQYQIVITTEAGIQMGAVGISVSGGALGVNWCTALSITVLKILTIINNNCYLVLQLNQVYSPL